MNLQKSLGRWLVYGLCLAPAVAMLGYYALEYIPSQSEYFMSLRFRSLSQIGDRIRTKVESLQTALDYATQSGSQSAAYLAALVPELTYTGQCGGSPRPSVEFDPSGDTLRFKPAKGCAAVASLAQIFSQFTADDLFDNVLLADTSGRVVYQSSSDSPRIVNLGDLRKSAADAKPTGSGTDADAVQLLHLDGSSFTLMIQPLRITVLDVPDRSLAICGLVRSQRLAEEARHVPPMYLLVIFAPLLIVFLSGPFLKIMLLTRTSRVAFHDIVLLSASAVIAAGLLTLLVSSWRQYWAGGTQSQPDLKAFADALNGQLVSDIERMRSTLEQIDRELPSEKDLRTHPDTTDLFVSNPRNGLDFQSAPFDFVFWNNRQGCQVAKWTTKLFNTPRVNQRSEQHFLDLQSGKFWTIHDKPFTLQTLVSSTTSQLIVIIGIPSANSAKAAPCPAAGGASPGENGAPPGESSAIVEAAMVGLLPSLTSPLIPPGAGFAIFDPTGEVIFHSSPERDLHENLFDEIRSPAPWQAAVSMAVGRFGSAYYRGRKYQLRVQPVTGIGGSRWNIAAFQELEPRQAMIGTVWSETLILLMVPICFLVIALFLLSLALRVKLRQTWRKQIDFLLARFWPDPARGPAFALLSRVLSAIAILCLAVAAYGSSHAYRSAWWLLPFSWLAPAAALGISVILLWKPVAPLAFPNRSHTAYVTCASLLLVLLAVVPTLGLFSICNAFENRLSLMRWQRGLMDSWNTRRSRIRAAINGSSAYSDPGKQIVLKMFCQRDQIPDWGGKLYAAPFWSTGVSTQPAAIPTLRQRDWWPDLLASIRPDPHQPQAAEAGALAHSLTGSGSCQWHVTPDPARLILSCTSGLGPVQMASTLPEVGAIRDPLWWLSLLAFLGCAYAWNCRALCRLFLLDFHYRPLPLLADLPAPAAVESDLLVLGIPLARKDEAVRQWLKYTPPRVNLYADQLSKRWIEKTVARVRQELEAPMEKSSQVAVGSATAQIAPPPVRQLWIHISNLETRLREPQDRQWITALVEKLIALEIHGVRPRLVITSTIDPIFHFDSVLTEGGKTVFEHPLTEVELQRLSRLLHNFRKVQVPPPGAVLPDWAAHDDPGTAAIYEECRHHQALLAVGKEIAGSSALPSATEALLAAVAERAQSLYKLFWACCTRSEKLLLIQLAQTGLVNPLSFDTLQALIRKGLILPGVRPRIMNETFSRFLATVETRAAVRAWESEGGESAWLIIRNVVLVLITAGLIVVAMTQREAMQTVTAVLTGVGTVMAGLFRLAGYFGARRSTPAESA
jgi:hypothetical protein